MLDPATLDFASVVQLGSLLMTSGTEIHFNICDVNVEYRLRGVDGRNERARNERAGADAHILWQVQKAAYISPSLSQFVSRLIEL